MGKYWFLYQLLKSWDYQWKKHVIVNYRDFGRDVKTCTAHLYTRPHLYSHSLCISFHLYKPAREFVCIWESLSDTLRNVAVLDNLGLLKRKTAVPKPQPGLLGGESTLKKSENVFHPRCPTYRLTPSLNSTHAKRIPLPGHTGWQRTSACSGPRTFLFYFPCLIWC